MNRLSIIGCVALLGLTSGISDGAAAQGTAYRDFLALQQKLSAATSLECRFSTQASGRWDEGTPKIEVKPSELKVNFLHVNVDEGTAEADSQFGASFIVVKYSNGYLHLMQMFSSGPLYTTTILAQETATGRMMAIHTRHEYTTASVPGFTSQPEMYFGDCAVGS